MRKPIHIINGPNLNLLGTREPEIYGSQSLGDIQGLCEKKAANSCVDIVIVQSNSEGELIDFIQQAGAEGAGIIINPAAYTHTSIGLHDALKAVSVPSIEIHLSQPHKRESFRRRSYVAQAVTGSISGFGANSYLLGVQALVNLLEAEA